MSLSDKSCVPCRGGITPLDKDQASDLLTHASGWMLSDDASKISREFAFKNFTEAMGFVNRVADLAEAEGHHPDFEIHWNKVRLVMYTHKIGGLHENDFIMAAKINRLVET